MQSPFCNFVAVDTQTGTVVRRHLDLVVGPDNEVLQQQVGHVRIGDVLVLNVHRHASQTVPAEPEGVEQWSERNTECQKGHRIQKRCLGKSLDTLHGYLDTYMYVSISC